MSYKQLQNFGSKNLLELILRLKIKKQSPLKILHCEIDLDWNM